MCVKPHVHARDIITMIKYVPMYLFVNFYKPSTVTVYTPEDRDHDKRRTRPVCLFSWYLFLWNNNYSVKKNKI